MEQRFLSVLGRSLAAVLLAAAVCAAQIGGVPSQPFGAAATAQPGALQARSGLNLEELFRFPWEEAPGTVQIRTASGTASGAWLLPGAGARGPRGLRLGPASVDMGRPENAIGALHGGLRRRMGTESSGFGLGALQRNRIFFASPNTGREPGRRLNFSAVAAVRAGGDVAFLGASSLDGMSAGFGARGRQYGVNSLAGAKPLFGMNGLPGTAGSEKHPTASVTLKLSF